MGLTQGLHRSLQATPDVVATIFGDRVRTFRDQADRVARLAAGLRELGVDVGDRVAILAFNSDRYEEFLFAVSWAGAVLNPVNTRWSATEIVYALNDSGTVCLFVDDAFTSAACALRQQCPALRWLVYCGEDRVPDEMVGFEDLIAAHRWMPDAHRSGDDLAGLFYTGGTTGFPKGVMLSHRNIVTSALGMLASGQFLPEGSRLLHAAPMFHMLDVTGWAAQVLRGGVHVIIPAFKADAVWRAIREHAVTDLLLVPTMVQMLVDDPSAGQHDGTALRRIFYGGSAISEGLLARVTALLSDVTLTQGYGATEFSAATLLCSEDHRGAHMRAAGRALPHAEIQIIDGSGHAAPIATVGQICVRGDAVMHGYWKRPEETAAVLVDGWCHTGDAGYLDDHGFLYIVDRIKDMIITGGENVYCAEVENTLGTHPSVLTAAVIGLPSEKWGETVHAVVVPAPNARIDFGELQEHVRARIASYKVPRSIEVADHLPLSGAGKVLKHELRERARSRAARGAPSSP
jgi:acyl-CoA synthetase (AMP-forming)/AMP-acid ligase II